MNRVVYILSKYEMPLCISYFKEDLENILNGFPEEFRIKIEGPFLLVEKH